MKKFFSILMLLIVLSTIGCTDSEAKSEEHSNEITEDAIYDSSDDTSDASIEHYCDMVGCSEEGTFNNRGLDGKLDYYCAYHYLEVVNKEHGKNNVYENTNKHICEECSNEGTYEIEGISGLTEYYCSTHYQEIYDKVTSHFPEIKIVTMDAGYKTPWICKKVIDDKRIPSLPYKRPMTKAGFHEWFKYVYDEYLDIIICLNIKV